MSKYYWFKANTGLDNSHIQFVGLSETMFKDMYGNEDNKRIIKLWGTDSDEAISRLKFVRDYPDDGFTYEDRMVSMYEIIEEYEMEELK